MQSTRHAIHHHRGWVVIVGSVVILGFIGGTDCQPYWQNPPQFPRHVVNGPRQNNQQQGGWYGPQPTTQPSPFDIVQGTLAQLGADMKQWSCKHLTTGREIIFALQDESANNNNNKNIYNPGYQQPQRPQGPPQYDPTGPNNQPHNPGFVPAGPSTIPLPGSPNQQTGTVPIYTTTTVKAPLNFPNWDWNSYATINPTSLNEAKATRSAALTTPSYNGEGVLEPRIKN